MGGDIVNILIAEDEKHEQDGIVEVLKQFDYINVVGVVSTGEELIQTAIVNQDVTALLLDLNSDECKKGLNFYSQLIFKGRNLPAILITNNITEASYSHDLGIVDTIMRPFTNYRLEIAVSRIYHHIKYKSFVDNGGIFVPIVGNDDIIQVSLSDILFIQSEDRIIHVHTVSDSLESKVAIKAYENYLYQHHFLLTHRSTLVNLKKVSYIDGENIHFKNDTRKAFVTESKKQELQMILEKFANFQ